MTWLGAALPAQAQTPNPAPAAAAAATKATLPPIELVVQNLTPFARREGAAIVVPFAEGRVHGLPALHIHDTPTAWQPFGASWPDGSLRQALCLFTTELKPLAEARLALEEGPGPALPTGAIPMPNASIEFVVRQGDTTTRATAMRVGDLEANPLRRVELRRVRIGKTGLVGELIVTAWRDQPHAAIDTAVFFSDPGTPSMQCAVDELAIECRGMAMLLRHAGRLGIDQATTAYGSRTVLLRKNVLGDGQGLRRTGALVPPLHTDGGLADSTSKAACVAPLLGATTWQASGAFGVFGLVPEMPPWLRGDALRLHLAARHRNFVLGDTPGGDPFGNFPLGLARMAGQTGGQEDFGTVKLSLVAASGLPSFLLEVELSVLQEACRPVHCFEADASPVEPSRHPDWVVWDGRTHWHAGVSKDRLGKTTTQPPFDNHGWTGKDRQHWSSNYLGAFALLTGSHWARLELANEGRLFLAGQTIAPELTTSHSGAPRGAGRTTLAASWIYLVGGDPAIRQRLDERIDRVYYPEWAGRSLAADRVRPTCICDPDPRQLGGKFAYWNPWQEALAAVGFAAVHRLTGNPRARELAEALATTVVRHGWLLTERSSEVAMAMRWLDGTPFTTEQWQSADQTLVQWSYGTDFSEWSMGAVEIARSAALARGDQLLAEKAAEIQRRRRATRRPPANDAAHQGGLDALSEWDAVRWQ